MKKDSEKMKAAYVELAEWSAAKVLKRLQEARTEDEMLDRTTVAVE